MFSNNSRTFYNLSKALGSFGFLPLRGAGTGFVVVLPLSLIFDPPLYILHFTIYTTFHREATLKTAWELLDYSVNNNTRVYQIHKEGGVANRFLQLDDIFEPPGRNELIVWKTDSRFFYSLASHALRACDARALRARKHALPISLLILRKKIDCFAVYFVSCRHFQTIFFGCHLKIVFYFLHELKQRSSDVTGRH